MRLSTLFLFVAGAICLEVTNVTKQDGEKSGILEQRFICSGHDTSVIHRNVLRGDNITLDPGVEKLQNEHYVRWTNGSDCSGEPIAQWKNCSAIIKKSYEGVLQLNQQTGSLTLLRVTEIYAGYYCVMMLLGTKLCTWEKYLIAVFGPVSTPHITAHSPNDVNCYVHCSVESAPGGNLSWYRGEKVINQTSSSDITTNLTLSLMIQAQDEGNYSCVAANPVSKEAVTLNSTLWCPPHDPGTGPIIKVVIIAASVGVLLLAFVCCGLVFLCCNQTQNGEECFGMVNRTAATPSQSTEVLEDSEENVEQQDILTAEDQH